MKHRCVFTSWRSSSLAVCISSNFHLILFNSRQNICSVTVFSLLSQWKCIVYHYSIFFPAIFRIHTENYEYSHFKYKVSIHTASRVYSCHPYLHTANNLWLWLSTLGQWQLPALTVAQWWACPPLQLAIPGSNTTHGTFLHFLTVFFSDTTTITMMYLSRYCHLFSKNKCLKTSNMGNFFSRVRRHRESAIHTASLLHSEHPQSLFHNG